MKLTDNEPINFVESIFHYLSPFSAHQISYKGENFMTLEHAYQAAKFKKGVQREEIKQAKSPLDAWRLAQEHKKNTKLLTEDFDKLTVMEELMRIKLQQHPDVKEVLLASKNRGLLKVYPTDYFWGTGHDGTGRNEMGKLWMKIRSEIQTKK